MVQVVLSLEAKADLALRELAREVYGGRKGALSKVVEDSLELMRREVEKQKAHEELVSEARKAKKLGVGSFKRSGLYD